MLNSSKRDTTRRGPHHVVLNVVKNPAFWGEMLWGLIYQTTTPEASALTEAASRRGGEAYPVDRMQAGRDTPPALARGQAGPARPD